MRIAKPTNATPIPDDSNDPLSNTQVSAFEKFIFSNWFAPFDGAVGFILTVVFCFYQNWILAGATVVSTGSLFAASLIGRIYARQLRHRYNAKLETVQARLESMQTESTQSAQQNAASMAALHLLLREARYGASTFSQRYESVLRSASGEHGKQQVGRELADIGNQFLRDLLGRLIGVFSPQVRADASLWAAIRIIRKHEDETVNHYETLVRAGAVDADRAINERKVREDRGLPRYLRQRHSVGDGIVVLDSTRTCEQWEANPNDERKEDQSVMAGPVFLRTEDKEELVMIVYLNSPIDNLFDDSHKCWMQCCVDIISAVVSMMAEFVPEQTNQCLITEEAN